MSNLLKELDIYLDTLFPSKNNKKAPCCDKMFIDVNDDLGLYSCRGCGVIYIRPYNKDDFDKNKNPTCIKTYIPYHYKTRHLTRLSNWSNYCYKDITINKLLKYIDKKMRPDYDRELIMFSKILFKYKYKHLSIRANIKNALIVYCVYQTGLTLKRDIEIDNIIKLFDVSVKNYNDLNKKLKEDKLFYFNELNEYLEKVNMKHRKNEIIKLYNLFLSKSKRKFMKKSIILGLIYFLNKDKIIKKNFYKMFSISKTSIKNILLFINEYDVY